MKYNLIVAADIDQGIGYEGAIPWCIPEDLKRFSYLTKTPSLENTQSVVIMGRKTWTSLPHKYRPLRERVNIIISRQLHQEKATDVHWVTSPEAADQLVKEQYSQATSWVIGGTAIYQAFLEAGLIDCIYLTRVHRSYKTDTVFPQINSGPVYFQLFSSGPVLTSQNHICQDLQYQYLTYQPYPKSPAQSVHQPLGEYSYLSLLQTILQKGLDRPDRTGIGTRSLFGYQMRFSLYNSFPLLTTKKMFLRGVVEELLWFLRGETDAKILQDKKVRIWDGNSSRTYLDSIGLSDYREGDCGPIYGFNFRHFGASYINCDTDYTGQGYDQFKECVRLIKEDPFSRRIMINLWNPGDLDKVALPPCHVLYQFYVEKSDDPEKGDWLSCSFYQRSGDVGLGIPFNIASASLLTYLLAHLTGKRPKELIHNIGDAHVYQNHLEPLKTQINRTPYPFPQIKILDRHQQEPEDFQWSDFQLVDYHYHPSIKMMMAV